MGLPAWASIASSVLPLLGNQGGGLQGLIQRQAMRQQMGEFQKEQGLRDTELGWLNNSPGLYDPAAQLKNLYSRSISQEGQDAGALGAAYSAAGFRPGDTPINSALEGIGATSSNYRDNLATTLPQQMMAEKLGAYASVEHPNSSYPAQAANEAQNYTQPSYGLPQALSSYMQWTQMNKQQQPAATPVTPGINDASPGAIPGYPSPGLQGSAYQPNGMAGRYSLNNVQGPSVGPYGSNPFPKYDIGSYRG